MQEDFEEEEQLEEEEMLLTPAATALNMHLVHLGKIFFRLAVFCGVLCIASILSLLLTGLVYLLGFFLIIVSLGLIFVFIPNYWQLLTSGGEFVNMLGGFMMKILPYLAPAAAVFAIAAAVLLLFDKDNRHAVLITLCAIVALVAIVVFIIFLGKK